MVTRVFAVDSGTTAVVPTGFAAGSSKKIHAIGGGQAGHQGTYSGPGSGGDGGDGADYSVINTPAVSDGQTLSIQIGQGGVASGTGGQAGTDTWLKNNGGTIIVLAKGGASGSANVGTVSHPGGAGGDITSTWSGALNYPAIPGYGGAGGGAAGGPTSVGSDGGDTSYTVGGLGGSGGGASDSLFAAPGQQWLTAGYDGASIGYGAGRTAGVAGGKNGFNHPFGHLNGGNGGGAGGADNAFFLSPPTPDQTAQGGTSGPEFTWQDATLGFVGPGGGGGGGAGGYHNTSSGPGPYNPGYGGAGGLYGGGGAGSGGVARAGDPTFSSPYAWLAWAGVLGTPGDGAQGLIVFEWEDGVVPPISDAFSYTEVWGTDDPTPDPPPPPVYTPKAVHFSAGVHLDCASLTCTDNGTFSISLWFKDPQGTGGLPNPVYNSDLSGANANYFYLAGNGNRLTENVLQVADYSAEQDSRTERPNDADWHHFLLSADTTGAGHVATYIDGALATPFDVFDQSPFAWVLNGLSMRIGDDGSNTLVADICDLWIAPGVSLLDGSFIIPAATVELFINGGQPQDPAGFPAGGAVLFSGDASTFATNQLSGGTFTTTGALTTATPP